MHQWIARVISKLALYKEKPSLGHDSKLFEKFNCRLILIKSAAYVKILEACITVFV